MKLLLAQSGEDALRLVLKHGVFAILLDVRRMRARDGDEDIYLRKPLEPDVIRPALAQLLAAKEPR